MRTHLPKLMLLGLGGGVAAYLYSRRRPPFPGTLAPDPADPVQGLDDLDPTQLDELDVDAMSMVDSEADVELATVESSLDAAEAGQTIPVDRSDERSSVPDDDQTMDDGRNWIEALETTSAENGPLPEQAIEIDEEQPASLDVEAEDAPVADLGSGGPAGA